MIQTLCSCGSMVRAGASEVGTFVRCRCGRRVLPTAGEEIDDAAALGDFDARLIITAGPHLVGDSIAIGGIADLEIGRADGKSIMLNGERVSRAHARLVRIDFGPSRWKLVDTNSRTGIWVNGKRITEIELVDGCTVRIGEYELRYAVGHSAEPSADAAMAMPALTCPGCGAGYPKAAEICTTCGINLKTGKLLVTSKDLDENDVAIRADTWIRIISVLIWLGLFPIASEAFGTHKPRATWVIFGITVLVSLMFLPALLGSGPGLPPSVRNLLLWTGSARAGERNLQVVQRYVQDHPANDPDQQRDQLEEIHRASIPVMAQANGETGQFHWYQLLTNTLLHEGIMHLAGNMCFLLVFGLRVNELIGDWKMAVIYPLLAVLSSGAMVLAMWNQPIGCALGASGAIMGLAGMYFIFFPVQKVHLALWVRTPWVTGWEVLYRIWRVPGFWLLGVWVGLNDVLPTLLGSHDHIAHWAHLGGFICGAGIAVILMVSRQVDALGADLLTLTLGRRVWAVIGTPASRAAVGVG